MSKRASTPAIIAATFGWDVSEVSEYRYQATRTPRAIYAIGDKYYSVAATQPAATPMAFKWKPHTDQFWASQAGTVLWVADSTD